jgi:membrane protein implicated in regulation of membrane protease activity
VGSITFWVVLGIMMIVLDLITSSIVFSWFAVGSIAAIIAKTLGASSVIQIIIFLIIGIIALIMAYPIVKKVMRGKNKEIKNVQDEFIGEIFISPKDIDSSEVLSLKGSYWTVKNPEDKIKKGDKVIVTAMKGNSLIIEKYKSEGDVE